jgi:hypothetical protein
VFVVPKHLSSLSPNGKPTWLPLSATEHRGHPCYRSKEAEGQRYKTAIAMVAKNLMVYHFSVAKRIVTALLLGLLAALLIGLWITNGGVHKLLWKPSQVAYGVNVDMTAMIPSTPYTVTTASGGNFFDLAERLGINTLRITDVQWTLTGKERQQAAWRYVFDEAENHHMNIILLLVDGGTHSALEHAHTLLGNYGLAGASALWMVDLDNEPDLSDPQHMAELREEAAYVHQVAPAVPVTIGGWKSKVPGHWWFDWQDPADIPRFINLVDVVSPHLYGFEQGVQLGFTPGQWTRRYLNAVRQEAKGKPILLEEFGAGNGLAPTTDPTPTGSPEWQASVYRGVLQEVSAEHDQGVLGAVAWIVAPRPAFPYPNDYERDMTGWAFVLNQGRRLLPAAQTFSP